MVIGLPNLVVVLVEPQTAGNVGFTTRVMANFGVTKLRVVGIDPRQEEDARRFSMRALDLLESAEVFETLADALEDIQNAWAATARAGRNHSVTRALVPLRNLPDPTTYNEQIALVFGRESSGLTNEEIDLCSLGFNIPTSNEYQSMNLSHAVGVTLFHLYTEYAPEEERIPTEARVATKEERRQTSIFFDEIVDELSIKDFRRPIAKRVFRNLMDRAYMTGREITTLTGTVRKIRERILGKEYEE